MRRTLMIAALVLGSASAAFASSHYETTYYDTIRPNGHPRSDAIYNAALDDCYSQTGAARDGNDPPAFRACMTTHGYRWLSAKLVQDPASRQTDDSFIDPDTGMSCHNTGFASICEPPQGTVHYTNKHGLNCTRTGLVSICSNL
jgi:hypothetical protein